MPLRCITFDLDDTLWDCAPILAAAERTFYAWLCERYAEIGARYSLSDLVEDRRAFFGQHPDLCHDFTYLRKRWLESLGERWGQGDALVEEGFRVFWEARNAVELFAFVPDVLRHLGRRYRIGAITNGNACVRQIGIDHLFDFVVTAAEAGAMKPHPGIFHRALELAGAAAGEVVHVGDDPVNDIEGAAGVGMRTVWINPAGSPWAGERSPDADIESVRELAAVLDSWR